jgi:hypothetical protein
MLPACAEAAIAVEKLWNLAQEAVIIGDWVDLCGNLFLRNAVILSEMPA